MRLFKDNNGRLKTKTIFVVAVCIVIVICVSYFLLFYFIVPVNMEKRGQFGDMFGFIGALFSGLAFAGLIVTMLQQREDLQNQKDEIKLQRQDLEAQTEALKLQKEEIAQTNKELKEQNKTIMLQRFENTFFNMLDFQMRLCERVRFEMVSEVKFGYDAIIKHFEVYRAKILTSPINFNDCISIGELDHVHRHWTQILKLIDQTEFLTKRNMLGLSAHRCHIMKWHCTFIIAYHNLVEERQNLFLRNMLCLGILEQTQYLGQNIFPSLKVLLTKSAMNRFFLQAYHQHPVCLIESTKNPPRRIEEPTKKGCNVLIR